MVADKQNKISIRFFNDQEVRAAWDYGGNRWLFSVVDVIAVLTDSKNPRNYWKVLKHRLTKTGNKLVTNCNQLKMVAADGKRYLTDCLPQDELLRLIEAVPTKHASAFALWLITGENQILKKCVDWSKIDKTDYMEAMRLSPANPIKIRELITDALTDKINDREMFMKGIDYSYYYEQND